MIKTKLAHAVATAIAGTALLAGATSSASASTTMYNTFVTGAPANTDGWVYGFNPAGGSPTEKGNANYPTATPWLGTSGLPFNYTGKVHLNWAVSLTGYGDSAVISAADSTKYSSDPNYGGPAEIDTGSGAWKDVNGTGWKHQIDIGLIKTEADTYVKLNLTSLASFNDQFGVTVFEGMDNNTHTTNNYSHHGGWNNATIPETTSNPFYINTTNDGQGMTYLIHDPSVDSVNSLVFFADHTKIYSIALGGNGVGDWNDNVAGYQLSVNAVPVPAAVWLFGSALAGLGVFGRRKDQSAS